MATDAKLDRNTVSSIRADIDAALLEIIRKHGLSSLRTQGTLSYDPACGSFSCKVVGVVAGGKSREVVAYEQSADLLGLPPLGSEFNWQGRVYKTVGLRGGRAPLKTICDRGGKLYSIPVAVVASMFRGA